MDFDQAFVTEMSQHLSRRLTEKRRVLREGGEQALMHSPRDITRIQQALKRITDGSYGICSNCGTIIDPERLRIIPEAACCTVCAQQIEAH